MSHNIANTSTSTIAPTASLPTVEEINGWDRDRVKGFLQEKRAELGLGGNVINVIYDQEVSGKAFLRLNEELLTRDPGPFRLKYGPASAIAELVEQIKGEQPGATEPSKKRVKIEIEDTSESSLKDFWQALKITEYNETSSFLEMSENINFLGKPSQPSKLFIRKCYKDLVNVVLRDNIRNLRLTGNPGIGKTFFGYFLLYSLARRNETIIYDIHTMTHHVILFNQEEARYLNRNKDSDLVRIYLSKPEVWYIVDGRKPDDSEAKTILICSPLKNHFAVFDKRIPDVRYMQEWSWDEINTCKANMFKDLTVEKVRELYSMWGGIPRYVLEGALMKGTQDQLASAIATCDESIFRYLGGSEAKDDISHKLIHIWTNQPDDNVNPQAQPLTDDQMETDSTPLGSVSDQVNEEEPYTKQIIKFASDYVGQQVILILKKIILEKSCRDMDTVLDGGDSNPVMGCIFEQIAHRALRNGGTFNYRSLDTNNEDIIVFPKRELILFSQIDEIQNEAYSIPLDKSFPSLDAMIAPSCLLQMTTAISHPIKINGLKKVQSKLETGKDIVFYFVVPAQLYKRYRKQKISLTDSDEDALNFGPWIRQRLKQYVLEVDLKCMLPESSELSSSRGETCSLPDQEAPKSKCKCKGDCLTNHCGCQRKNLQCGDDCHPKNKNCKNFT